MPHTATKQLPSNTVARDGWTNSCKVNRRVLVERSNCLSKNVGKGMYAIKKTNIIANSTCFTIGIVKLKAIGLKYFVFSIFLYRKGLGLQFFHCLFRRGSCRQTFFGRAVCWQWEILYKCYACSKIVTKVFFRPVGVFPC